MAYESLTVETAPESNGARWLDNDELPSVVIVDPKLLFRECLTVALQSLDKVKPFRSYQSVADWRADGGRSTSLVVLCQSAPGVDESIALLKGCEPAPAFAIISYDEDVGQILKYLDQGAQGYIPIDLPLQVVVQALRLIDAGGVFIPASSLAQFVAKRVMSAPADRGEYLLSAREFQIARALREGTHNKLIAANLNICESTVKVHVRNLMKKCMAKNRTEVAFLCSKLFDKSDAMYDSDRPKSPDFKADPVRS